VLSSEEGEVLRKFKLQGHQEAYSLERVEPLINIISQENIFVALHLVLVRKAEAFKEAQQIVKTTVNTAKYLGWRPHSHQTALLEDHSRGLLTQPYYFFAFEWEKGASLALTEQCLQYGFGKL